MANLLIIIIAIPLFFMPKINLISIGGESAGIRADDILLVFVAFMVFIKKIRRSSTSVVFNIVETRLLLLLAVMFLSNATNTLLYGNSSALYSIRILEYFIFFYVGVSAAEKLNIITLTWLILLANAVAMVGQALGVVGGFASEGFANEFDRVIGLTGGPWEIGALINLMFCVLAINSGYGARKIFIIFIGTLILILLTKARQPLVAHFFIYAVYLSAGVSSVRRKILYVSIFLIFSFCLFIALPNNPIIERSAGLLSVDNVEEIKGAFYNYDVDIEKFSGFEVFENSGSDIDMSWQYRLFKWATAIVAWCSYPLSWIIGFGPGTWGLALDGGWLRMLTETGLVGLFLFIYFLRSLSAINAVMRAMIIAFSLNMTMIDVHNSYKIQQYIFFAAGYYWTLRRRSCSNFSGKCEPVPYMEKPHFPETHGDNIRLETGN